MKPYGQKKEAMKGKARGHSGGVEYPYDCDRIVAVAREHLDINMTPKEAEIIWKEYSDSVCAGWLSLDWREPDEIISAITAFINKRI